MNEVIRQLHERKSVRAFEDREIPKEIKNAILEAAKKIRAGETNAEGVCAFPEIPGEDGVHSIFGFIVQGAKLKVDPVTGAVGAAHAGWRGTAADIGGKTVETLCREFGCKPENIRAAIGPNIGPCHFQTDSDVPEAMVEAFGPEAEAYIRQDGNKYYVNLKEINALGLRRAGVRHIEISVACTMCQPDRFWSHRFTGGDRGSQGAIILCKEGVQ